MATIDTDAQERLDYIRNLDPAFTKKWMQDFNAYRSYRRSLRYDDKATSPNLLAPGNLKIKASQKQAFTQFLKQVSMLEPLYKKRLGYLEYIESTRKVSRSFILLYLYLTLTKYSNKFEAWLATHPWVFTPAVVGFPGGAGGITEGVGMLYYYEPLRVAAAEVVLGREQVMKFPQLWNPKYGFDHLDHVAMINLIHNTTCYSRYLSDPADKENYETRLGYISDNAAEAQPQPEAKPAPAAPAQPEAKPAELPPQPPAAVEEVEPGFEEDPADEEDDKSIFSPSFK